jgi:hypothetical protein
MITLGVTEGKEQTAILRIENRGKPGQGLSFERFFSFSFKGRMRSFLDQHRWNTSYLLIQFGLRRSIGYSVPYTKTS